MFSKDKPLPGYEAEFAKLGPATKSVILAVQKKYRSYWWNPYCKVRCTTHGKSHKYSFEAYIMGAAVGFFGADSVKEMQKWLSES